MANRAARRASQKQSGPRLFRDDVMIGYLHPSDGVGAGFCRSLVMLTAYDMRVGSGRVAGVLPFESGANIVTARNLMVRQFLEVAGGPGQPPPEWLWIVDADMVFDVDTLDRLLVSADPKLRPVVGGLCFSLEKGNAQAIIPTIYMMNSQGQIVRGQKDYPPNEVIRVLGTGAACLLVHRSVFETIRDATVDERIAEQAGVPVGTPRFSPPWPWFAETVTGTDFGDTVSEDLTFCLRVNACGLPVHVDTGVKIGHSKTVNVDEAMFLSNVPPVEAPAPTFVVIPVKGKQELSQSILEQLEEQGGADHVYVYDNADTDADRFEGAGLLSEMVTYVPATGLNIHEMWNLGIKEALNRSPRCNIAILNNDLELGPNFLEEMAAGLRAHPSIACVGANYDGRDFPEKVQAVRGICAGRYDGTGGLPGFAFMVRGELMASEFGLFDEQFELWFGDNDLTLRLDKIGATYGIVRDATCVHVGGGSQTSGDGTGSSLSAEYAERANRDRERFVKKWPGAL